MIKRRAKAKERKKRLVISKSHWRSHHQRVLEISCQDWPRDIGCVIIHSGSNRGDFAKKTVLDTQLDKLIMHSIKRSKKASERAENGELEEEGKGGQRKKRKIKRSCRKDPKLVFNASFAVENRVIRRS